MKDHDTNAQSPRAAANKTQVVSVRRGRAAPPAEAATRAAAPAPLVLARPILPANGAVPGGAELGQGERLAPQAQTAPGAPATQGADAKPASQATPAALPAAAPAAQLAPTIRDADASPAAQTTPAPTTAAAPAQTASTSHVAQATRAAQASPAAPVAPIAEAAPVAPAATAAPSAEAAPPKAPQAPATAPSDPAPAAAAPATTPTAPAKKKRGARGRILMLSLPLILAGGGASAWLMGGRYVTTDNAYVHQPMVAISPDVSGRITEVMVQENQAVTAGTPLFRIDDAPYQIALTQSEAALASARLAVEQLRAAHATAEAQVAAARLQVAQLRAGYASAQTQLASARSIDAVQGRELARQQDLTERGAGTQSALDAAQLSAQSADNAVAAARAQLAAAAAALGGDPATADDDMPAVRVALAQARATAAALGGDPEAETDSLPSVRAALAARDAAARNLSETLVVAPGDGIVSQIESLNVGQFLGTGGVIATLVGGGDTWIEANFKETQLDGLRLGLPVEIDVDAYPDAHVTGVVDSFGSATGSQFSLIPAQNATGNWVKVVQRVPVRIRIDSASTAPLLDGMSVSVSVDTGSTRLDDLR